MAKGVKQDYSQYVAVLKTLREAETIGAFPCCISVFVSSDFLREMALQSLQTTWKRLADTSAVIIESGSIDVEEFRPMWNQVSMFEPNGLYVLTRCDKQPKLAKWLHEIPAGTSLKSKIVFEFSEKITAENNRQLNRLHTSHIPAVEPEQVHESINIIVSLIRRERLVMTDDAIKLLRDSIGNDLSKLYNEARKIILVFSGRESPVSAEDIAPIIGVVREDHVFDLFGKLRANNYSQANLLVDQLIERGEKGIALGGILSRFCRDSIQKGQSRGLAGLAACSDADIRLKTSRVSETLILGGIIDELSRTV